jgi:hypothetical protein
MKGTTIVNYPGTSSDLVVCGGYLPHRDRVKTALLALCVATPIPGKRHWRNDLYHLRAAALTREPLTLVTVHVLQPAYIPFDVDPDR